MGGVSHIGPRHKPEDTWIPKSGSLICVNSGILYSRPLEELCTGVWSASQLNATVLTRITGLLKSGVPQDFLSLQEQAYPRSSGLASQK